MNKKALDAKKKAVEEITAGLQESKSFSIVSYHGLTVANLTELRSKLAEKGAHLGVYKNTMVARALKAQGIEGLDSYLEGPNAFVFSKEPQDGPSVLLRFSRYHEELVLRAGLVEGKVVDEKGLKDVAKLPSKEVLLSMFCMVLNEPVAGFARAVKGVAEKDSESAPAA